MQDVSPRAATSRDTPSRNPLRHDRSLTVVEVDALTKPAWVGTLLGAECRPTEAFCEDALAVEVYESGRLSYVQVVAQGAAELDSRDFQQRVTQVYGVIRAQLERCQAGQPLRFWNFIPDIHGQGHDGMVNYEVFNAGRFEAFSEWYGTRRFGPQMVAASGVGHRGRDFVVQALAAAAPGKGVENPRQRAAYRYSKRYGPMPPCFARATVAPSLSGDPRRCTMIVAGTASIVGEDSCHYGLLECQFRETCKNLASLVATLGVGCAAHEAGIREALDHFRELRVYLVDDEYRDELMRLLAAHFPSLERLELMPADLCRENLMVEIESMIDVSTNGEHGA